MSRFALPLMCVTLSACGLERDWHAWQELKATNTDPGTSTTAPDSTGGTSTSGSSTSSSADTTAADTETGQPGTSTGETTETSMNTTSDTLATTGPMAVCGDGIVAGEEECDDPGDTACFNCVRDRLVFVTSKFDFQGDFSLAPQSLDYWCNFLASAAGLLPDKKFRFKPWVSTSEGSAAERLHHSRGRYVLRNSLVFALSWDALVAGEILNPLNVDEKGETRKVIVWTNTAPNGSAMDGEHCNDWTSDSFLLLASFGESLAVDGSWTFSTNGATNPTVCGDDAALYCFESP